MSLSAEHDPDPRATTGPFDAGGGPRPTTERIVVVDAVRGFALFGILMVNAMLFLWPVQGVALGIPEPATVLDAAAATLVTFAFEGKFFTLFSLLFGIGVAMQLGRGHPAGRIRRRLLILGAFGLLHVSLLWWGDILLHYAILGVALLVTREWAPRRLVRAATILLAIPVVLQGVFAALGALARTTPEGTAAFEGAIVESAAAFADAYESALVTYGGTDVAAMIAQRWSDWGFATTGTLLNGMLLIVVAMFLLGAAAQKGGWATADAADRWRWAFVRALPVALLANVGFAALSAVTDPFGGTWAGALLTLAFVVGAPSGAIAIASGLALALRRSGPVATGLAAVGRLALSTYLMQSLIFTILAYGYGVGLYGTVSYAQAMGLVVTVFAVQVALAVAYTRRFAFGPVEWLWRTLTYGRRPT